MRQKPCSFKQAIQEARGEGSPANSALAREFLESPELGEVGALLSGWTQEKRRRGEAVAVPPPSVPWLV